MASRSFGKKLPQRTHLVRGRGLSGELADLRKDVDEAFTDLERDVGVGGLPTPGEYGQGLTSDGNGGFGETFDLPASPLVGNDRPAFVDYVEIAPVDGATGQPSTTHRVRLETGSAKTTTTAATGALGTILPEGTISTVRLVVLATRAGTTNAITRLERKFVVSKVAGPHALIGALEVVGADSKLHAGDAVDVNAASTLSVRVTSGEAVTKNWMVFLEVVSAKAA